MIEFLGAAYCNILREGCRNGKAEVKRIMAQIPIAISAVKRQSKVENAATAATRYNPRPARKNCSVLQPCSVSGFAFGTETLFPESP